MSSALCPHDVIAILELRSANGRRTLELRGGDRLFVGSDPNSDLPLSDAGVAPTHCAIIAKGGVVTIEDCYSPGGTFVDDRRIQSLRLSGNVELRVGSSRIEIRLRECGPVLSGAGDGTQTDSFSTRAEQARPTFVSEDVRTSEHDPKADRKPTLPNEDRQAQTNASLTLQLLQSQEEIEILQRRLETMTEKRKVDGGDPFQAELIEILKAEVLELQSALAERQTSKNSHRPCGTEIDEADTLTPEAAEKLVDRLEQLLRELQERDDQIATLTELLELSEGTHRGDSEERDQLQGWLKDIEQRFGSREQEWQAERDELQRAVDRVAAERDLAEAAIHADTSDCKLEAAQNVLVGLRQIAEEQRGKLQESEQTIAQLRRQVEETQIQQSREERVQLAQERAEVARQRQELEAERQKLQNTESAEAALRLRALRQHLKEIHQDEQVQQEEERMRREERKLSHRLAKLWHRIDGR